MSSDNLNQEVLVEDEEAEAPVEEAPVEEAPVEEAPVEEASVEEASVEAAVEEAPVEEASVEEAPVEEEGEAPVEEEVVEGVRLINKNNIKKIEEIRENRLLQMNSNRNEDTSENDLNENSEDIGGIKRGQPIDYNKLYENLEKYCNLKRQTHWMCAKYYNSLDRVFLIPSICLSSFSGIASFLSSVESFESYQTELSVGVGIMASCTTLLQSFSNAFGFSTKAEAHQNATESFDQIITKIRFQKVNPKDGVKDTDFITELENQIVETKQRCKYVVPEWVEEEYRDNKFNSLKGTLSRNVYKQLANIKTDKYLSAAKKKEYSKINLDDIDLELGLKDDEKKCCCC
tara:strand:+ start:187 stop:1221 length:1035 start_codon:yes stop_codon:yes gene_type:complete